MENKSQNSLDAVLKQLAEKHVAEVVQVVRSHLAQQLLGTDLSIGTARASIKPVAPALKAPKAPGARRKRRGVSEADLAQFLSYLAKNPNSTSMSIQEKLGVDKKKTAKVLAKLRDLKKVKIKGDRNKMTYSAAA